MADPTTAVAVAPLVDVLTPYAVAFVGTLLSYLAAQGLNAFTRWTGARIDATYSASIEAACANEAGKLVAGAMGNLATAQINVGSPGVAAAANAVIGASSPMLKKAVAASGLTPQLAASLIVGQIGKLQAQMTSAAPVAKP